MYKPHHFSAKCMLKTLHCVSTFFDLLQLYFSILKYVGQHLFFGAANIFSIHRAAGIRFRFLRQSHILFVCRYTAGVHIPNDCNAISFLSTCLNGIYDQENKEAHTPQK